MSKSTSNAVATGIVLGFVVGVVSVVKSKPKSKSNNRSSVKRKITNEVLEEVAHEAKLNRHEETKLQMAVLYGNATPAERLTYELLRVADQHKQYLVLRDYVQDGQKLTFDECSRVRRVAKPGPNIEWLLNKARA